MRTLKVLLSYNEPNWIEIYWQIQKWFPHDSRFNSDNFGEQPEWLIFQAYEQGKRLEDKFFHNMEIPIASLHSTYYNAHIDSKKNKPVEVKQLCYFSPREKTEIPSIVGDIFFSLIKDKLLPSWVVSIAPIDVLTSLKTGYKPSFPRAFIGDGVIIFSPVVKDHWLEGAYGLIYEAKEQVWVEDIDNPSVKFLLECSYDDRMNSIQVIEPEMRILNHG